MQQIRCGLCGRQTLVDPASPGTCPSCGFPLSVPAEDAAPISAAVTAPATATAAAASPVAAPAEAESAIPAIPAQPTAAASDEPLAVGPIVTDPAPIVPHERTDGHVAAPTGADFVVGPVVGDPAPATRVTSTASQTGPVETAAYVPPVPVTRTAEQDASDTADMVDMASGAPFAGSEDDAAAPAVTEPESAPLLALQPLAFDASDAAIVAVAEPDAVAEDIYVTRMAEPVAEPAPAAEAVSAESTAAGTAITQEPEQPAMLDAALVSSAASPAEIIPGDINEDAAPAEPDAAETAEAAPAVVAVEPAPVVEAEPAPVPQPVAPADLAAPAADAMVAAGVDEPVTRVAQPPAAPQDPAPAHPSPQPPAYPPYPPPAPAAYPGYGPDPRTQPPGPYPYPPQQPPTSPYPYGAQQPPATAPYPLPFPVGPGGQIGQMSPMGQMPPASRRSRTGLVVAGIIIAVVVLALIIAAIAALLLVRPARSAVSIRGGSSVAATPTASTPAGFERYQAADGAYSLNVPSAWTQTPVTSSGTGVTFQPSANGTEFEIVAIPGADSSLTAQQLDDDFFTGAAKSGTISNKQAPTTVEQGGDTWTQESADITSNGYTAHAVVAVAIHGGTAYLVTYVESSDNFATENTQYFQPMFASFQFLK